MLQRKAAAGAKFVITQPVFDAEVGRAFLKLAANCGLKAILGVLPVKRDAMAAYLKDRVKDLSTAAPFLDRYAGMSDDEAHRFSITQNLELMRALAREAAGFSRDERRRAVTCDRARARVQPVARERRSLSPAQGAQRWLPIAPRSANHTADETRELPITTPDAEISVQDAVRVLLKHIGEDPEREGLRRTPERVVQAHSSS